MYLKNKSETATVILKTRKGFKTVLPLGTIEVEERDLLTGLNSNLVKIAKEEIQLEAKKEETKIEDKKEETKLEDKKEETIEIKKDELVEEVLEVKEVEDKTELELLEEKLESLKQTWETTSRPKKKETLQKEIKEIQTKIEALK